MIIRGNLTKKNKPVVGYPNSEQLDVIFYLTIATKRSLKRVEDASKVSLEQLCICKARPQL